MAWIDQDLANFISRQFPDRKVYAHHEPRTWQSNRYIWVTTTLTKEEDLHYEYYREHVELHLEGKFQSGDYRFLAKELRMKTARIPNLIWSRWQGHSQCRCTLFHPTGTPEELLSAFHCIMSIFDPIIKDFFEKKHQDTSTDAYNGVIEFHECELESEHVSLETCSLDNCFLIILSYLTISVTTVGKRNRLKTCGIVLKKYPRMGNII